MENNIGDRSHLVHSSASRAMNLSPDEDQIKQYDEYSTGLNPFGIVAAFLTAGTAYWTWRLFSHGHWIWGILLTLVTLFLALLASALLRATLKKSVAYESGLLVSAIVINTNPLQILVLADMRTSEDIPVVFGCKRMTVKSLPGHDAKLHEEVPCVSLFGGSAQGCWKYFEPRPVCWGYKDSAVIRQAIEAINNDDTETSHESEWAILAELEPQMKDATEKEVVFFNADLQRISL